MEALSTQLPPFFQWLVKVSFQASILVCLILLIRFVLRERLPIRWHYCLWLILLVRLSLPWSPQSRLSIYNLYHLSRWAGPTQFAAEDTATQPTGAGQAEGSIQTQAKTTAGADAVPEPGTQAAVDSPHQRSVMPPAKAELTSAQWAIVLAALPVLWLFGAITLGGYVLVRNIWLWRAVKKERALTNQQILDLLEDCKMQIRIQTIVGVVVTDRINSPALFGFVRPRILLPEGLIETLGLDELHHVLLHELAHLKRRDIYLAWLVCMLQVLHWFNPLIWFAFRRMRADQEMACDALVLSRISADEPAAYGRTIVSLLDRFSRPQYVPSLAGILENPSHIERRIQMIAKFKNNSYRWSPLALALVALLCCVVLPDARSGEAAQATSTSASGEQAGAASASDSDVFNDPETGIRFTKFKTLSGPSDMIQYSVGLSLSPNGKFLLWGVRAIPLDGSAPFDLVDMPNARRASWSPDGRKVAFYCSGALWLLEVDPDSGRPAGSPKKLVDGGDSLRGMCWTQDSEKIIFGRRPNQAGDSAGGSVWTIAITGGEPSPVTDPFSFGLVSPDGRTVATSDSHGGVLNPTPDPLWVKPVAGGEPRKVTDDVRTKCVVWSANSEWLVVSNHNDDQGIRFVRIADGHEVRVNTPGASGSGLIEQSSQGRKLLFYQTPYDTKGVLKVVSVAGGSPAEVGWPNLSFDQWWAGHQLWAHDSRSIIVEGKRGEEQWGFWDVPLDGKSPRPLTIDTPMCRDAYMRLFSPDGNKLLLFMGGIQGDWDLWTVPVSLTQMKSSGPAVKTFGGMAPPVRGVGQFLDTWSPDGSKIAFVHNWDIWVATADGKSVLQLTRTSEQDGWPMWSPDGTMVAFFTQPPESTPAGAQGPTYLQIRVVPATGGEVKTIAGRSVQAGLRLPGRWTWFPDGKELTAVSEDEGIIANFPIAGGDRRTVVPLKDLGIAQVSWLRWSPDGRFLAFQGGAGRMDMKLYVYQPDDAKLQRLADENVAPFYWSPDSRWISFFSTQPVKTRPEGVLWEMDVEKALAKLAK